LPREAGSLTLRTETSTQAPVQLAKLRHGAALRSLIGSQGDSLSLCLLPPAVQCAGLLDVLITGHVDLRV
jgi:hypothetical protein